jgi:hypothetical protein
MRLTCGALAGIASVGAWRFRGLTSDLTSSVVSTYPLDLIRSRLSIATANIGRASGTQVAENARLGIWTMTVKVRKGSSIQEDDQVTFDVQVYTEEGGFRALYRGMVPTAVVSASCGCLNCCRADLLGRRAVCRPQFRHLRTASTVCPSERGTAKRSAETGLRESFQLSVTSQAESVGQGALAYVFRLKSSVLTLTQRSNQPNCKFPLLWRL